MKGSRRGVQESHEAHILSRKVPSLADLARAKRAFSAHSRLSSLLLFLVFSYAGCKLEYAHPMEGSRHRRYDSYKGEATVQYVGAQPFKGTSH